MTKQTICILGGTGFVGSHLASRLSKDGHDIRVLTRRRERHRELLVLPTLDVIEANVHDEQALVEHFSGCNAVINLVGILNESKKGDFERTHVDLPRKIVQSCVAAGVPRLLHMSALHADAHKGSSEYLRTKGKGQDLVHASQALNVTSFRPSVIFGPGDSFFNRFAGLLKIVPALPLACPNAKFAPVFVENVAEAFAKALDNPRTVGQHYELCGPHVYTLKQLVDYTATVIHSHRPVIGLSDGLSKTMARIMGMLPGKPMSYDNYLSLQTDSVCEGSFPDFIGIVPTPLEAVVPYYLGEKATQDKFDQYRRTGSR